MPRQMMCLSLCVIKIVEVEIKSPHAKLVEFKSKINSYKENCDFLSEDVGSKLSVDLRFGTIATRAVLRYILNLKDYDIEPFIR